MKEWILEISAAALFTGIISLVLPDGKMSKTLKGIFAVFTAFLIIKPVIGFDFEDLKHFTVLTEYSESQVILDTDYLDFILAQKQDETQKNCLKILEKNGITDGKIEIEFYKESETVSSVKKVKLNLSAAVIKNENERIFIIEKSVDEICDYLKINRDCLTVYE